MSTEPGETVNRFVIKRRTLGASAVLVASAAVLSGCFALPIDPAPLGTAAIQQDGDGILLAVCKPIALTDISLDQRNRAEKRDWVTIWESTGSIELDVADTLSTSVSVGGLLLPEQQPTIVENEEFSLAINGLDDEYLSAGFGPLSAGSLSSTQWLQSNGQLTDVPCPPIEDLRS